MGATVVAFSTSAPEFFVSLFATIRGNNDISIGNVVGSNICNLGIAFALIAIFRPHAVREKLPFWNGIIVVAVTAFVMCFAFLGVISILMAVSLLVAFSVFTFVQIKFSKEEAKEEAEEEGMEKLPKKKTNARDITFNVFFMIIGIAGVLWGANIIVENAEFLGTEMGIPQRIIGLTVVAIGTSLPEIMTTIIAIIRKENAMSVGNLIGSNVFNITFILGIAAIVGGGLRVASTVMYLDLPIALLIVTLTVLPTLIWKRVFRWQGYAVALLYIGYIITLCVA
jgi:cation:H+ antiporter